MIQFSKPANLNGSQLITELATAGIIVTEPPMIDGNGKFWLNINQSDEAKTTSIVALHVGIDTGAVVAATFAKDRADGLAKLELAGLTIAQAEAVARKKP